MRDYLETKTRLGEDRVVVGIYLEVRPLEYRGVFQAEDFEYMKKIRKILKSDYVLHAIQHFRAEYTSPIFLIR